ncbi:acyltransferase family protein [Robertmurraya sp. GLU-23]
MSKHNQKMQLIQAFRGLAAILVLFHHGQSNMGNPELGALGKIFSIGWIGVDFFFVLSGFIIFYVHHKDIGNRTSILRFYFKRFIRVYPIYWIVTFTLMAFYFLYPNWAVAYDLRGFIKSFFLLPHPQVPIVSVGWTLVYEVFFYGVFGLLIILNKKFSFPLMALWVIGILLNSFNIITFENYYLKFIFNNYNLEFIFGSIVAYITLKFKLKRHYIYLVAGLLGASLGSILLIKSVIVRNSTESILIMGVSFALIVLSTAFIDFKNVINVPKVFLLLGDSSYSIYLTHNYLFILLYLNFVVRHVFTPIKILMVTSLLTLIAAVLFHMIIEKPIMNKLSKRQFSRVKNNPTQVKKAS